MKRVILAFLFAALFWVASPVQAETTVGPDKTWTITFNTAIDLQSADEAITVTNESGDEIDVDVWHQDSQKKHIKVKPSGGAEYPSGTYTLTVSKQVKSVAGVQAETEATKTFTVAANDWGEWTSVKALDIQDTNGQTATIHLLANQVLPQESQSTSWSANKVDADFKFGIETNGEKKVSDVLVTDKAKAAFYQNAVVDVDWQFRKIEDRIFVVTQMEDDRYTFDYYYGVKNGNIERIQLDSVYNGTEDKVYNDQSNLKHESGNTFVRNYYSSFADDQLKAAFVFNHESMKLVEQTYLTQAQMEQKSDYLQDKVRNIIYGDLKANGEDNRSYERVETKIDEYVTNEFGEAVKVVYEEACVDCNQVMQFNNDWRWDIHSFVMEDYKDRVIIETTALDTPETYGSIDWIVLKKEGDHWKLDEIFYAHFQKDIHLELSVDLARQVLLSSDFAVSDNYRHVTSYNEEVKDYYDQSYTTTFHRFKDSNNGHIVEVDASTGAIHNVE
ncbi:Ig-like domain-containing protein [Halobacillus locisalis]|uniref:Ig-like domain-containing protein n=1 Tax=Halobacillus locisalis TaxID=220753 RepID=A0A838CTY5_9BACI|nr:Ig-like domain-containing protein [Halobacillus locisalis]MBA2175343.1 Ig-like domain-containing protein [Halobacillus locisalis]